MIRHAFARACCLAVALVTLLAGCADRSLSQDARFDATSPGGSDGKGLIVVGLRVVREPVWHDWLRGDVHYHPAYRVWLGNIDEAGQLGPATQGMKVCEEFRGASNGLLSDCVPSRMQYKVLAVPPGRYAVGGITYTAARVTSATYYIKRQPGSGSGEARAPIMRGDPVAHPERSITVRAGEIVYAGDLSFDFEPRQSSASLRISRSDERARAALAGYPNIHGDLVFRPLGGAGVAGASPQL